MPRPVVLDNTVLTNFALVKHTALVFRLWPTACTTAEVMAEYQHGASLSRVPAQAWSKLPIVSLSETERSLADSLSSRLGAGERTCLAVAYERHGLFVSDDLDARLSAQRLGLEITGTLGVLVLSVKRKLLSRQAANDALTTMIASGYRSPLDRLDSLL
jgi:predicted nucleic acid-binding protein